MQPVRRHATRRDDCLDAQFKFLRAFGRHHPDHRLTGRAYFLAGKCKLGSDDLDEAEIAFRQTIEQFPGSEESHKSKFKIAMIQFLKGEQTAAQTSLKELAQSKDGPYTPEAVAFLDYLESSRDEN